MAYSVKANEHRRMFKDRTTVYELDAATDPDVNPLIACQNAKHQIFVQRITVHVTTSAAQAVTFASSTGSVTVAVLPASAAAGGIHVLLDSEEGIGLPAGADLDVSGAAGVAGIIEVQAYERLAPGAVLTPADI